MYLLVKNAQILTMDMNMKILENGFILIKDSKIIDVGPDSNIQTDFKPEKIIDAGGKLVMPGFVNAHTHAAMSLMRNYADDVPLEKWLFNRIFPVEDKLIPSDVYWGSMLSIIEMIKSGTTCFTDMYFFMDEVARAVFETGMRANLSRGLICPTEDYNLKTDDRIRETRELYQHWNNKADGRIKIYVAPHAVYTCSPPYLKDTILLARELGTGIHIHLLETRVEASDSLKNFGCTSILHCDGMGMFDVPTIAAHCVHLTDEDIKIIKQKGVNVAYNPGSNLKLGSGVARIPEMLEQGINVALGTDGPASNNNLDMLEEIRLAALISKGVYMNPELVSANEALRMATVNGAKALGFSEQIGEIKPGLRADLIIINTDKENYYPRHDIISAMAYSSHGTDVETVIVDGKILMENNELKTIDEEKVKFEAQKAAVSLMAR